MKVQLAQIPSDDSQTTPNLVRVLAIIQSAERDTDVIVFPETCLMGFPSADEIATVAEPAHGATLGAVLQAVQASGIAVVIGFAEADGGRYYNTTVLIAPEGIVLTYRKTHLWASDIGVFTPGDQLPTAVWKGLRVGLLICFDVEFPETARALAGQGAELLFVTNANMDPYGPVHRALLIARAMENQIFIAMANRCGSSADLMFAGESAVFGPTGAVLASLGREPGSLTLELDLAEVAQSRSDYRYVEQRRIALAGTVVAQAGGHTSHLIPS